MLSDMSRRKGNQLVEYNMRNIFLKKDNAQNVVEKLVPDPFFKKSKLSISLNQQSKDSYNLF